MTKRRILLIGIPTAVAVVLLVLFVAYRIQVRQEMIQTTLEWGRLASFPDESEEFTIEAEGSMFSRAFRSRFKLNPQALEKWIALSPGLREAKVERRGSKDRYEIQPGGGAQGARVEVDSKTNQVEVYVYWS